MSALVIQPVPHRLRSLFSELVVQGVTPAKLIDTNEANDPVVTFLRAQERVSLWTARPLFRDDEAESWRGIDVGTVVAFLIRQRIVATGRVVGVPVQVDFHSSLYERHQGWRFGELMYLLADVQHAGLSLTEVKFILNLTPETTVLETITPSPAGAATILKRLALSPSPGLNPTTPPPLQADHAHRQGQSILRREEHAQLRWLLRHKDSGTCCLCGKHLPSTFLRAIQLSKYGERTSKPLHDPHSFAVMCTLGCSELFETCAVVVVLGSLRVRAWAREVTALQSVLSVLEGRACPAYVGPARAYFDAHALSNGRFPSDWR